MRALLVAASLLAPLAAAADPIVIRTEASSVIVQDTDGDGEYDWANSAIAIEDNVVVNVNLNRTAILYEADVTTEEAGGHEAEALLEDLEPVIGDAAHTYYTIAVVGAVNGTSQPGVHDFDVLVSVLAADHETGVQRAIAELYLRADDRNGDGVPEDATIVLP